MRHARPLQLRRRWALIWLLAFAALAVTALGLPWWTSRDPVVAGRSQALADAEAFESALASRGRVWRAEILASAFEGGDRNSVLLAFRWDAQGRLIQPSLPPVGRELADERDGSVLEEFTPARAWLSQARQVAADSATALEAAQTGIELLESGEIATGVRLRLIAAQAAARLAQWEDAVQFLEVIIQHCPPDALLDGRCLALLAGHRLADALEADGDPTASRLTREDLRARILASQLALPASEWERELRFLREADGENPQLTSVEQAALTSSLRAIQIATALQQDSSRNGFSVPAGVALLDPMARRGALFEERALHTSLSLAWREVLPSDDSWEIAAPAAPLEFGRTLGAVEPPQGLTGGWRLVLRSPEIYVEAFARRQRGLWIGAGLLAVALLTVGAIGRRALLRQAELERMRVEFIAGVSHELRTPAASLALLAENLAEGRVQDEARRIEYYAALRRDARRLQRLVADVMDASRLERESFRVSPAPCDPASLLRRVADEHHARLADAGLALHLELPTSLPEMLLDADAIERALANLLENARKYASGGDVVRVSARMVDGSLRIAVEDRGPGIPLAWRERAFEPFERVPDGAPLAAGAGLGLALVRATAEAHGGNASVEPGTDGIGARFVLRLPVAGGAEA